MLGNLRIGKSSMKHIPLQTFTNNKYYITPARKSHYKDIAKIINLNRSTHCRYTY